ncbi:MarR family winged helix-turn-helix transcriptional regulator [Microtetraspora niveoalba]|uniref:MarR family winged helix-turn-helix transcriptional regulator n=1 Tax=Microtetraspora niveoalba TaxID=46175 RepID=UPI00082C5842|nr:MarR family transcriptional regulator [Microtetraspora niveoalba]
MVDETADSAAPSRLMNTPSWLMTQTATHAHRMVSEGFAAAEARAYHYRLLAALEEFGPASQAALGRRCGVDRSDMVAMINELADRRLLERAPDPSDRRRNIITITPAGSRQLRRLDDVLAEVQEELLAPLDAGERGQLAGLLARVLRHHQRGQ